MLAAATRTTLLALVACAAACTEPPDPGHGAPADARPADATPDGRPDAMPDAPPAIDADHDGHPAGEDCDDHDPDVWQNLGYAFRDADGDGRTVAATGIVCSGAGLPAGYSLTPGEPDCNDADPAVFTALTGFVDVDGDDVGDGAAMTLCTAGALPAGFAATAGDCAPLDPARWQTLAYSFRDVDGDGAVVPELGLVCSGAELPASYLMSAPPGQPFDCNDGDPGVAIPLTVFADADGDHIGAGPAQQACTNGAPPPGFAATGTDCDDADATVWQSLAYTAVDFDADGVTVPATGTRCTAGVLLPPYFATPHGNDCDDTNPQVSVALTVFVDADGDGFGAGPAQQACTDGTTPRGFATNGTDCNDGDVAVWMLLGYQAVDNDGDGVTVAATGQVCSNGTLPPPFKATPNGNDCDDHDPALTHFAVLYPDHDGDGVGAPPRQVTCVGAALPAGLVVGGFDDDDGDPSVIELDDDELALLLLGS